MRNQIDVCSQITEKSLAKHRHARLFLAVAAALCLLMALSAREASSAPYPPVRAPLQAERVPNSNVYYVVGEPAVPSEGNGGFTSNAGFVVTKAGVVVYDALGTPSLGFALLQAIREITDQPIRYVVAGHYHADHIYGLQAFRDHTDALIIAQRKTYLYIGSEIARQRLEQRRVTLAPWVNAHTRVVEPDITFTDEITLRLGDTRFEIVYAGPAHAPDDILMTVQPDGVLFAGDIVQNQRIPSLYSPEVDTKSWLDGLTAVLEMQPQFVIPGHGEPLPDAIAAIEFTQGYIRYIRENMRAAVQNWEDFGHAYEATDWSRYEDLPAFNSTNERNAYSVYLEMEKALLKK